MLVTTEAIHVGGGETRDHEVASLLSEVRSHRFTRICDAVVALSIAILALPVVCLIWAAIRLTSAGPGFYSQLRVGMGGRLYRIYKLRTMYHDCERLSGACWSTKRDSRITPLGKILRKLHVDELPQLWNVILGDMALVGPRPERPEFVKPLSAEVEGYGERHRVRPGVTGLAQIQLPADTDVNSVRKKLVLDRHYIEQASFWLDIRILIGTVVYLLGFSYVTVRRLTRLPNPLAMSPEELNTHSSIDLDVGNTVDLDWLPAAFGKAR